MNVVTWMWRTRLMKIKIHEWPLTRLRPIHLSDQSVCNWVICSSITNVPERQWTTDLYRSTDPDRHGRQSSQFRHAHEGTDCAFLPPVAWGNQNSANFCPCACRNRRLIMGYKLSYTTGLLYAWSSCMQWSEWVLTVGHWVVLVQVIYCFKGGWVLFLKEPTASLTADHELQTQS